MQSSKNCFKQLLILIFHVKTKQLSSYTNVALAYISIRFRHGQKSMFSTEKVTKPLVK